LTFQVAIFNEAMLFLLPAIQTKLYIKRRPVPVVQSLAIEY
jgi:hypothetical protein